MTAASAPEEGRKCWLKVKYDGVWRKLEWNTSFYSFQALETKVKEMFRLNDKVKLNYTYLDADGRTEITMSSDEELTTALLHLTGDILTVLVTLEKRKRKGILSRALRAAKTQRPHIAECLASLPATARTLLAPLTTAPHYVAPMRAAASGAALRAGARFRQLAHVGTPSRKVLLFTLVLLVGLFLAHNSCHTRRERHHDRSWHYHHPAHFEHPSSFVPPTPPPTIPPTPPVRNYNAPAVTILAATYGGMDVTQKLQDYYTKNGIVLPSNSAFGDPTPNFPKHLHVVYQFYSPSTGVAEVFSQSFSESASAQNFAMAKEPLCGQPEEVYVNGHIVKVLGAMYEDQVVTCATKRLAATGRFTPATNNMETMISRANLHFSSAKIGIGHYTLVYLKDNKLRVFKGKDGNLVRFD